MNFSEDLDTVYISLGSDCAVAYNLKKLKLSSYTFPFDWAKINNIDSIQNILENDFSNFFDNIKLKKINSYKFINFDHNEISKISIILENGIILPHECTDVYNEDIFKEKYTRRINRFREIVINNKIKKIFVRADDKQIDLNKLKNILDNYNCLNYKLITIDYSHYKCVDNFTWQREYIAWDKLFLLNI